MKHLSYRRIIILSKNIDLASKEEKEHIQSCSFCCDQIKILSGLDKKINEISRIDTLVNDDDIVGLADAVFDRCYKPQKKRMSLAVSYFMVSLSSVFFAALALFVFSKIFNFFPIVEEGAPDEKICHEYVSGVFNETEDDLPHGEVDEGKTVKRDRYTVHVIKNSVFFEENDNYITVRSGKMLFDVEGGGDFVVNLNNIGLVRVLGTSFSVNIGQDNASVEVFKGLVEVIDLGRGESSRLSAGESGIIGKPEAVELNRYRSLKTVAKPVKSPEAVSTALSQEMESLFKYKSKEERGALTRKDIPETNRYRFKKDAAMMEAEIRDLEFILKFSNAPVAQLHQLFSLLSERKHYGSIIHYWRVYSRQINSEANPFLQEMHRDACDASIKLFLYDNGVCRKYRELYPSGPDPSGMKDHLDMAW